MKIHVFTICFGLIAAVASAPAHAVGFSAMLENPDQPLAMNAASVSQVSLQNDTTASLYITGASIKLSDNAVGAVYTSAFNQEGLNVLGPGQRWEGPLVRITPRHSGPLLVVGRLTITGGASTTSVTPLAVIPMRLWISDTKRSADGGFLRGVTARCDRSPLECCEEAEPQCVQRDGHCMYVAEGFDQERVCLDGHAEPTYEHVTDVQRSADSRHWAYRASAQCSTDGTEEHCRRSVVIDGKAQAGAGVPGKLTLSPDGNHYAYRAYRSCITVQGEEKCDGFRGIIVDGQRVATAPAWIPKS